MEYSFIWQPSKLHITSSDLRLWHGHRIAHVSKLREEQVQFIVHLSTLRLNFTRSIGQCVEM